MAIVYYANLNKCQKGAKQFNLSVILLISALKHILWLVNFMVFYEAVSLAHFGGLDVPSQNNFNLERLLPKAEGGLQR